MIHHAGRGGNARGTSNREDVFDTVIHLKCPEDDVTTEGAGFGVHLTKARGIFGQDAEPFEAKLESLDTRSEWTMHGIRDQEGEQALDMSNERMSVRDIAEELTISKSKFGRIQVALRSEGRLSNWVSHRRRDEHHKTVPLSHSLVRGTVGQAVRLHLR